MGLIEAAGFRQDLIVLDLGLPDMPGRDLLRRLREWTEVPVLILSVCTGQYEKVSALDSGADDYLTKPFDSSEFLARLRVLVRRQHSATEPVIIRFGAVQVNLSARVVTKGDQEVSLTAMEYALLHLLITNRGKIVMNKDVELLLERVLWQSKVWLDGRSCSAGGFAGHAPSTPAGPAFARPAPANGPRQQRDDSSIGNKGQCYTDDTQTIWNSILGRIELTPGSLWIQQQRFSEQRRHGSHRTETAQRRVRPRLRVAQCNCSRKRQRQGDACTAQQPWGIAQRIVPTERTCFSRTFRLEVTVKFAGTRKL